MLLIDMQDVTKIYRGTSHGVTALSRVSLRVEAGDLVLITGSSGSGKTTLLNILGCLDRPSAGRLWINEHDVTARTDDALAGIRGRQIGFVFQHSYLLRQLTALENVLLPMVLAGERQDVQRAYELLAAVGLDRRTEHRPAELSGGEQQRVAIARALVYDPQIILADEPTGNLDQGTGRAIIALLTDLLAKDQRRAIVVVTHQPELIQGAHRHLELRDGHLVERLVESNNTLLTRLLTLSET